MMENCQPGRADGTVCAWGDAAGNPARSASTTDAWAYLPALADHLELPARQASVACTSDIPQMAVSFAGTELMVAIARVSRQRAYRSERCRRPTSRAMMGSTARLSPQ